MATALQGFRLQARSCQRLRIAKSIERRRAFSTVTALRAGDSSGNGNKRNSGIRKDISDDSNEDFDEDDRLDQEVSETLSKHDNPDRVPIGPVINQKDLPRPYIPPINKNSPMWDTRPEKHEKYLEKLKTVGKVFYDPELQEAVEEELIERPREAGINNLYDPPMKRKKKLKETFLNMGDPEPFEDENFDFEGDTHEEMTSMGHGELEQHREMRHYARLAAWEMPLLSKFAKPFVPPTADMVLRFRYTTYLGEQHPAEKKVVVEFTTRDMPNLTAVQRKKLVNLAGVRYNPEKDLVKMSCEMFPSQAQNKRYLGDLVDQMLREARDPKDTFEDVPVDMRHHKVKPKPRFPEGWKMTTARREELARLRENSDLKDQRRMLTGQLVDGIKQIEEAFAKGQEPKPFAELMMVGKGGKRLAVKR